MPAQKQVSKEKIVQAAFSLVREEGMGALNVTALSKRLGCSTQPIYLSFRNMDELKREVIGKIGEFCNAYLTAAEKNFPPYKSMGVRYIRLAREEKFFFQEIFMKRENGALISSATKSAVQFVQKGTGLDEERAERIHLETWLFVHGVATAVCSGYIDYDEGQTEKMLTDVFLGLKMRFSTEGK